MSANQSSKRYPLIDTKSINGLLCIDYQIIRYIIPINPLIDHPVIDTQNIHLPIDQIAQQTSALGGTTVLADDLILSKRPIY